GAGRPDKRWPIARYRDLARSLAADAGAAVLVTWGPNELDDARAIVDGGPAGRVSLALPTDLAELLAVLRRASVVVAGAPQPPPMAAAPRAPGCRAPGPAAGRAPTR